MADKSYLIPINMNRNPINNALMQVLAADPSTPVAGLWYYNSTSNRFLYYNGTAFVNKATDSDALNGQNANYYQQRANHLGTQLSSTISDLAATVQAYRLDQFAAPTSSVNFNGQRLIGVANGTSSTDGVNLGQLQNAVNGTSWKDEAQAASTANVVITSGLAAGQAIDGYTLVAGDRVLLKNQTTGSENGVYVVPATGAGTRATDADTAAKIDGMAIFVQYGSQGGNRYVLTNVGAVTVGTTALTYGLFGGGQTYTNGNGIALTTNVFSFLPKPSGGLLVDGSGAYLDPTIATLKKAITFGDASATSYTLTHNLNTRDVMVRVYLASGTYADVEVDVQRPDVNNVTVTVSVAPGVNALRAVIQG